MIAHEGQIVWNYLTHDRTEKEESRREEKRESRVYVCVCHILRLHSQMRLLSYRGGDPRLVSVERYQAAMQTGSCDSPRD